MPAPKDDPVMLQLKQIFANAAAKSTGTARPKFERLSRAFNEMNKASAHGGPWYDSAEKEFRDAMEDVQVHAERDPAARKVFLEMTDAVKNALKPGTPPDDKPHKPNRRFDI
jgi:hypothetical protein